jgi:hypothetical protein
LWASHRGALRTLGASRAEFFAELRLELSRFIRRLSRQCSRTPFREPVARPRPHSSLPAPAA